LEYFTEKIGFENLESFKVLLRFPAII